MTRYEFSEYPFGHPLYSTTNRKALKFFKDELNLVPMQQLVGVHSKCYASPQWRMRRYRVGVKKQVQKIGIMIHPVNNM